MARLTREHHVWVTSFGHLVFLWLPLLHQTQQRYGYGHIITYPASSFHYLVISYLLSISNHQLISHLQARIFIHSLASIFPYQTFPLSLPTLYSASASYFILIHYWRSCGSVVPCLYLGIFILVSPLWFCCLYALDMLHTFFTYWYFDVFSC